MADRIKLLVTEVGEPKEIGNKGAQKLAFKAKNPDGKELPYFTFRPTLFDAIKPGAEIDAEVEVKTREFEGNTYIDRQVSQIFIDSQPVGGQKKQWQPRNDTPEQRQSIEAQTAVKAGTELLVAGIIKPKEELGKLVIDWCISRLTGKPTPQPKEVSKAEPDPSLKTTPDNVQSISSTPESETGGKQPAESFIDTEWVKESLETLYKKKPTMWSVTQVVAWMKRNYKVEGTDPVEMAGRLDKGQTKHFSEKIQEGLNK